MEKRTRKTRARKDRSAARERVVPHEEEVDTCPADGGGFVDPPSVVHAADLPESDPPWVIEGVVPPGVTLLMGKPKCGKSHLTALFAISVATGASLLGKYPVSQPGGVLLVTREGGPAALKQRLTAARGAPLTRDVPIFILSRSTPVDLAKGQGVEEIVRAARDVQARLIVFDTLARCSSADENRADDMKPVLDAASQIATDVNAAVVIVHHTRKSGGADGNAARGSGSIYGAVDAVLSLSGAKQGATVKSEFRDYAEREQWSFGWTADGDTLTGYSLKADSGKPTTLRDKILEELAKEPRTVNYVAQVAGRSGADVSKEIEKLAAGGQVETATVRFKGREYSGWQLKQGRWSQAVRLNWAADPKSQPRREADAARPTSGPTRNRRKEADRKGSGFPGGSAPTRNPTPTRRQPDPDPGSLKGSRASGGSR